MPPLPTIPLVGGPFDGQRRPIIDGHIPQLVERLDDAGNVQMYDLVEHHDGSQKFVYKGSRALKELTKV